MTITEAEEHQPLLKEDTNGDVQRGNYQSTNVEIELLEKNIGANARNGLPNWKPWADNHVITEGKADKGLCTYSWRDIHVFALKPIEKRYALCRMYRKWIAKERTIPARGQPLLKKVTGIAYPGELTVIMGPSGAGKTTLLNALTFRSKSNTIVTGERYINEYPVDRVTIASLSAYVQQDEIFFESLSVREHLTFQAMVRMGDEIPLIQKMRRVDEVIDELDLRNCEHAIIRDTGDSSGISGGERKRLSLASELLTDPPMMFCDEPTSGLDSVMALNVIALLKSMSQKGKTVICTIHQPSSEIYSNFDKIILLSEGRTAFLGSCDEASDFFAGLGIPCPLNYSPADFYIELLAVTPHNEESSRGTIDAICSAFEQSTAGIKLTVDVGTRLDVQDRNFEFYGVRNTTFRKSLPYKTKWTSQFRALIWRSWICVIKDPMLIKMRFFQNIVVSILISVMYFQQKYNEDGVFNINGVIFTFLTNMTFQNVFAVMTAFCSEQALFLREHFSGMYRVDVYFLCKTLAEIPIFLALPTILVTVTYYTVGLNPGIEHFMVALLINILVANAATSFGYFISSVSNTVSMAFSIGPPVIIPFLLFGGFLLNIRSIPHYFSWLSYLSWFRYGNEALLINQWIDVDNIECRSSNSSCPANGRLVLEIFHFNPNQFLPDLVLLFTLVLLFRLLAFLALFSKTLGK